MQQFTHAWGVMGIYAIVHRGSGRAYLGSSVNIGRRWHYHRSGLRKGGYAAALLQADWTEYGEEAFLFLIVERVADLADLLSREQAWLDESRPYDPDIGYNRATRAAGTGFRWTDKQRARHSAMLRRIGKTDVWRAACAQRAVTLADRERCAALGRASAGRYVKASTRRKISDAQRGTKARSAVLNDALVVEIMWRIADGAKLTQLADEYGVHACTINDIKHGRSWTHITGYR